MTASTVPATSPRDPRLDDDLLRAVFAPASIALIGASDNPEKLITFRPIQYLQRFGFRGAIYPINPKYRTVQGLPCYPSVRDTPTPAELVVVALPRERVLSALQECADAGAKVAIVYSSGFAEVSDGAGLQRELTALAARTGMHVVGPNCQGVANLATGFYPCFSTAFATDSPEPGRAAIISQSGAVAAMIYNSWTAAGGGAKYWASTGNEADVTVARLARAAVEDPDIDTLLLYLESVRDADVLAALAERAAQLGKQVVAYRSTHSGDAWSAASRHTGAGTAAEDALSTAVPTGPHLHSVSSIAQLVGVGQLARSSKALAGPRLGVISNSGGLGVMVAEAAAAAGFDLGALAPDTRNALVDVLPGFASVQNPVDVTAQLLNDPALLSTALPAMLADTEVDALVVALGAVGDGYDLDRIRADVLRAHQASTKPIVVIWVGSRIDVRRDLGATGVPVFTGVDDALTALAAVRVGPAAPTPRPGPERPTFDDLFVGANYTSAPVVVTAAALDHYAAAAHQTDDCDNVHVNLDAARAAGHPRRVVAGLHTLTQITIIGQRLGLWTHSSAVAGFRSVRFAAPVYEGDPIALTLTVDELKPLRRRRGLVTFRFELIRDASPVATGSVDYVFDARGR
jgi:acyl-CoA synthetase (NDP forming)